MPLHPRAKRGHVAVSRTRSQVTSARASRSRWGRQYLHTHMSSRATNHGALGLGRQPGSRRGPAPRSPTMAGGGQGVSSRGMSRRSTAAIQCPWNTRSCAPGSSLFSTRVRVDVTLWSFRMWSNCLSWQTQEARDAGIRHHARCLPGGELARFGEPQLFAPHTSLSCSSVRHTSSSLLQPCSAPLRRAPLRLPWPFWPLASALQTQGSVPARLATLPCIGVGSNARDLSKS